MPFSPLTDKVKSILSDGDDSQAKDQPPDEQDGSCETVTRSKATQFTHLLENRGGRMKQATLVSETQWSAGTVSRVLSKMETQGHIHKISVGRENVITLVGAEPEWYDPPAASAPSSTTVTDTASETDSGRPILLVEDDPQAGRLLKEAFYEANIDHPIHIVRDGLDAVDFLLQRDGYTDAPRPALMLLDLSLEVVDGVEVLAELEEETSVSGLPVLVLSQSDATADIHRSYANGATAYLTKPDDFEGLVDLARAVDAFWLTHVVPAPAELTST